jgi:hypothetical protein
VVSAQLQAPVLPQQQYSESWHGRQRRDEYHWLSGLGPSNPQVGCRTDGNSSSTVWHSELRMCFKPCCYAECFLSWT